jgi:ABC-2 type transport system permease protein
VRVRAEQSTGTLEAVLATPVQASLALLASTAYDLVRSAVQAVLLLLLATLAFGMKTNTSPAAAAAAAAAAFAIVVGLSSLGVLLAAVTLVAKQIPNVPALLSGILLIVSGLWFPVGLAPRWVAAVGRVSPVYWALEVTREGLLSDHVRVGLLLALLAFAVVALPLAVLVYDAVVRHVRQVGTLPLY